MPALISGYEYDIFISYRQKDNKYDGWVTEFVANLKKEIEATFKEDVSIYFDVNPNDGLLETHHVNASLEGKLRCLIFIPIISQTYCDPKSFAWEHEFCAFNRRSKQDKYGRDIKLSSGNVASRILPVKIHDLDEDDKAVVEQELGGVMRPIEFIYKSAGVNRPLRANEDHPQDNLNKVYYRDQINKVANAVKEIITGLKKSEGKISEAAHVEPIPAGRPQLKKSYRKLLSIAAGAVLLVVIGVYFFVLPSFTVLKDPGSSGVAVLPFRNFTGSEDLNYYGVGMASEIRTKLSMSKQFSFISSLQATLGYSDTKKTPKEIGAELDVDYLLSGLYQKAGNKLKVEVELIDASTGRAVWSLPIESELTDIFEVQTDIAARVLRQFSHEMLAADEENAPTKSLAAYAHYTRGIELVHSPRVEGSIRKQTQPAIVQFQRAIQLDSGFIDAWAGLVQAEAYVLLNERNDSLKRRIEAEVNYVNNHFPDSWQKKSIQAEYAYRVLHHYDEAIDLFLEVLQENPENIDVIGALSGIYRRQQKFNQALQYAKKMVEVDPVHTAGWHNLKNVLSFMGDDANAMRAAMKAWELSRLKSDAGTVLFHCILSNYPLDQLPAEFKQSAGSAFTIAKLQVSRDWKEVKRLALEEKDYPSAVDAYLILGQKDSARYWSAIALKEDASNVYFRIVTAPDLQHALDTIEKFYTYNNKEDISWRAMWEVVAFEIFGRYPQATERLIKLNSDFPDWGFYSYLNRPYCDKIKKEYPPFQEALNNLKRKPLPDVSTIVKW